MLQKITQKVKTKENDTVTALYTGESKNTQILM